MRRRAPEGGVPAHLARFVERDWPGQTVEDQVEMWRAARRLWHAEHGWPGGPLALLRDESDLRRRMAGLPLWSWGRTPAELEWLDGRPRPGAVRN